MTDKRYFSIDYDEEYYIFDSTKISKEKVLEEAEYSYDVFGESLMENEVVELLNENEELKEKNYQLESVVDWYGEHYEKVLNENNVYKDLFEEIGYYFEDDERFEDFTEKDFKKLQRICKGLID